MTPPRNILIIRLSSLGDILHTLPALRSLRTSYPDAQVDWLVEKRNEFLLSAVRSVDDVIAIDTKSIGRTPWSFERWREAWRVVRHLRSRRYDLCFDFQGLLKTGFLGFLSGAGLRIGFPSSLIKERPAHWFYHSQPEEPKDPLHVVQLNLLLTRAAGASMTVSPMELSAGEEAERAVDSRLQSDQLASFVVINPGGGWPTKRWSPIGYGLLTSMINSALGLPVVITTGPGEEKLFDEIARNCQGFAPIHFQIPFLHLIPLLRKARLLVGGDSGPLHLACAIGTPVVGIFGPTSPVRNGPWPNPEESVVHMLPCSFCYGRTCPTNNECMDISVDEVFNAVVRRLGRTQIGVREPQ